jgi:hypothetical protein
MSGSQRRFTTDTQKRCSNCEQWKPLEEFHRNRMGTMGRDTACKLCRNPRVQQQRNSIPLAPPPMPKKERARTPPYRTAAQLAPVKQAIRERLGFMPANCETCPARWLCDQLPVEEPVLCELSDSEVGIPLRTSDDHDTKWQEW